MKKEKILQKEFLIQIGRKVKKLRESKNLSQNNLAKSLSISRSSVQRIEKGEYDVKATIILALTDVFKTDANYLYGTFDNKNQLFDDTEKEIIRRVLNKLEGGKYV